jgi:ferredoxin-NADP reductase/Na+-transporting NADH:ubiquinone oxidoreductase subunit NqrB
MLNAIDRFLNGITMYRLVLYVLMIFLILTIIFGATGMMPYSPAAIIFSAAILLVVSWATNELFAKIFKAQPNVESVYITALILALIISPALPSEGSQIWFLIWAAVWAMASKYVFAIRKKHIFNPAAFAVVLTAFTINQSATWWTCGTLVMIPFIIIGGLLITRKIQRFDLVFAFLGAAIFSILMTASSISTPLETIQKAMTHAPIFFFAFIMLTEPLTTPPDRQGRIIYGVFTGLLFAPRVHIGPVYSTPELALIAGNILSYWMSPKSKIVFSLEKKEPAGESIQNFIFQGDEPFRFLPGQYLEWTLAHENPDTRGNRRYFTIASSPTEEKTMLGVRIEENGSSFKKKMKEMRPGDTIIGGALAGDFILPDDESKKLVFLAGGIGITPFRSMIKFLCDTHSKRSVVLLYGNRNSHEIAYQDIFEEAEKIIGLKTVYAISSAIDELPTQHAYRGRIDRELIKREIPDYKERIFYISGTHAMVSGLTKILHDLNIPRNQIRTDFFPGF